MERKRKIVGGVVTLIEQTPYQVSLLYRSYHSCGGKLKEIKMSIGFLLSVFSSERFNYFDQVRLDSMSLYVRIIGKWLFDIESL